MLVPVLHVLLVVLRWRLPAIGRRILPVLRTVLRAVSVVLLEIHVVLELRRVMHIVRVLPLPRLPLRSLVCQLRVVLRLVPLRDRFELVVPVLRLLHVVR